MGFTYLTLGYSLVILGLGVLVGIVIENRHNQQQKLVQELRLRRLNDGESIESQMAQDGWII
jgi:hypothetical protein